MIHSFISKGSSSRHGQSDPVVVMIDAAHALGVSIKVPVWSMTMTAVQEKVLRVSYYSHVLEAQSLAI